MAIIPAGGLEKADYSNELIEIDADFSFKDLPSEMKELCQTPEQKRKIQRYCKFLATKCQGYTFSQSRMKSGILAQLKRIER